MFPRYSAHAVLSLSLMVLAVLAERPLPGQENAGVRLRYVFSKGDRFKVAQSETVEVALEANSGTTTQRTESENEKIFEVLGVAPDGSAEILATLGHSRVKQYVQGNLVSDEDTRRENPTDPLTKVSRELVGQGWRFKISGRGQVTEVTGLDEMLDKVRIATGKIVSDREERAAIDAIFEGLFGEEAMLETLSSFFPPLPEKPLRAGGTWTASLKTPVDDGRIAFELTLDRKFEFAGMPAAPQQYVIRETTRPSIKSGTEGVEFKVPRGRIEATYTLLPAVGFLPQSTSTLDQLIEGYADMDGQKVLVVRQTMTGQGKVVIGRLQLARDAEPKSALPQRGTSDAHLAANERRSKTLGILDAAHDAATRIESASTRAAVLTAIAEVQFAAGNGVTSRKVFEEARDAARGIAEPSSRARSLDAIDRAQGATERKTTKGSQELDALLFPDPVTLAQNKARAGGLAEARKLLAEAAEKATPTKLLLLGQPSLARIARAQAEIGDREGALQTARKAPVGDGAFLSFSRSEVVAAVAEGQAEAGDIVGARATLLEAEKLVPPPPPPPRPFQLRLADARGPSLAAIAAAWARLAEIQAATDKATAREYFDDALRMAQQIEASSNSRAETFIAIARAQAKTGDSSASAATIQEAQKAAESRGDGAALVDVGKAWLELQNPDAARHAFIRAARTEALGEVPYRYTFKDLALAQARAGFAADALAEAATMTNPTAQAYYYVGIAESLLSQENAENNPPNRSPALPVETPLNGRQAQDPGQETRNRGSERNDIPEKAANGGDASRGARCEAIADVLDALFLGLDGPATKKGLNDKMVERLHKLGAKLAEEFADEPALRSRMLNALGTAHFALGDPEKAVDLLERALMDRRTHLGKDHADTLTTMQNLASAYQATGRLVEAEALLRDCLDICQRKMSNEWLRFQTLSLLGACLARQAKPTEAEQLLLQGYDGLKQSQDAIPTAIRTDRLAEALERLIDLYDAWRKPDEAAAWRRALHALKAAAPAKADQGPAANALEPAPSGDPAPNGPGEQARSGLPFSGHGELTEALDWLTRKPRTVTSIRFEAKAGLRIAANVAESTKSHFVAVEDFDGDGLADVVITATGPPHVYCFRNLGGGEFKDCTSASGLETFQGEGTGAAVADYDCDGRPDLFLTSRIAGASRLYRNSGRGRFTDVTGPAGVLLDAPTGSCAWIDIDADGWADLSVTETDGTNRLFRNNADGTFTHLAKVEKVNGKPADLKEHDTQKKPAQPPTDGAADPTETAINNALGWLAQQQPPDGSWSLRGHYSDGGNMESHNAATGLALMAFLGAGQTHKEGKFTETVQRGLDFLTRQVKRNGSLHEPGGSMYAHAIGSIVLCEAYAKTQDKSLAPVAQSAIAFTVGAQDPNGGGWRYRPGQPGDTSVTVWAVKALASARKAGLTVPENAFQGVRRYLDLASTNGGSRYVYLPTTLDAKPSASMTAAGLLCRMHLGWPRDHDKLNEGVKFLLDDHPPKWTERDVYYWYHATQLMHQMRGNLWKEWDAALRDMLIEKQINAGDERGSWSPEGDRWGPKGGRLFVTCLSACMLETCCRHPPMQAGSKPKVESVP
ncbi:MAG: VCBS repeat-containing protein [Planctomycetia bacterium]|nr:VCBS repeat-containing protein [Planctomycetia bacterium]